MPNLTARNRVERYRTTVHLGEQYDFREYSSKKVDNPPRSTTAVSYDNVKVKTINDENGNKIGYDLYIIDVDVTLPCRWSNGTMIGTFNQ